MSSIVDALYEITYNPFEYGPYLASFYMAMDEAENNLLLAPLVIPLCSHPIYGKKISGAKFGDIKQSTIWTVFDDRTKLYDLQERMDVFQTLTEQCVHYCLINEWLYISEQDLSLRICDATDLKYIAQKSSEKLGRLYNGHSVVEIYAFLGVKPR